MNKKVKWGLIFGTGLLAAGSVVGISTALTSCSNDNNSNGINLQTETFNPLATTSTSTYAANGNSENNEGLVYSSDPTCNPNAIAKANSLLNNISKSDLQKDFNMSITKLYDAYELENDTGKNELEAEIQNITVVGKDNSEPNTWILKVDYDVEQEINDKESEGIVTQYRKFKLDYAFASQSKINQLKQLFAPAHNGDVTSGNNTVDLSDLYEFYFGEKDADDLDDIGIFDKLALYKQKYNKSGNLWGYNIDLLALAPVVTNGQIKPISQANAVGKTNTGKSFNVFTPSFTNSYFFYASLDVEQDTSKLPYDIATDKQLNLFLDPNKLANISSNNFYSEFNALKADPSAPSTGKPSTSQSQVKPLPKALVATAGNSSTTAPQQNGTGSSNSQTSPETQQPQTLVEKQLAFLSTYVLANPSLETLTPDLLQSIKLTQVSSGLNVGNFLLNDPLALTYTFKTNKVGTNKTVGNLTSFTYIMSANLFGGTTSTTPSPTPNK